MVSRRTQAVTLTLWPRKVVDMSKEMVVSCFEGEIDVQPGAVDFDLVGVTVAANPGWTMDPM